MAAFCALGGFAETAVAPEFFTFALPDELDFAQGAALILNYHTAYFSLLHARAPERGRDRPDPRGRRRRRHGLDPGRAGAGRAHDRARLQRAKAEVARDAGADEVVLVGDGWKDEVKELSGGGVDVVLDPVGGDRFTDSLRSLREDGRLVVVGFTGGSIPEVKVNRLLLGNTEVDRSRLGRIRDGQPEFTRADRRRGREDDRGGLHPPDHRRALPAGAGRAMR